MERRDKSSLEKDKSRWPKGARSVTVPPLGVKKKVGGKEKRKSRAKSRGKFFLLQYS